MCRNNGDVEGIRVSSAMDGEVWGKLDHMQQNVICY